MARNSRFGDFDLRSGQRRSGPAQTSKQRHGYQELQELGRGGQGIVYKAQSLRSGKVYALKEMWEYHMMGDGLPKEVIILRDVVGRHRNIIELKDWIYQLDKPLLLYFESCNGGNLKQWMQQCLFVPEESMWTLFIQLANAIAFLHYGYDTKAKYPDRPPKGWQSVIHADIKPENVLLREYKNPKDPTDCPQLVLGDFGSAVLASATDDPGLVTTPHYQPPEIKRKTTRKSDVWSVGAIVQELGDGNPPFDPTPRDKSEERWLYDARARRPRHLPPKYSRKLNRVMMETLQYDDDSRINSKDLLTLLWDERPT